uniref:Hydroxymethylglutaryl-CoA synthase n=1 Tax=Ciona intestinalis TaxID=7719 RepID=F6ZVE7_CIOIN|nr:hydroxymethylglutaryl-CoA synthase 1 [Ciona intestinalis]|eukprot:XP_026690482.1 hydroxymethylglutaryl-CoA synthase 1 [Ciona intestinalis]
MEDKRPENVGILAMEVYFPSSYVDQNKLEDFDGVSKGKYTKGLGQEEMGFCHDNEDINSLCLTVVARLMEKNHVDYKDIGRLEVGTETIIDKSKSVKSVLMQLFDESGNFDVEGVDTSNACYGGTSALFNAVAWVESSAWDGRYALVVCGDIAVYASGNARCTGGAGSIAMLIGPSAPLVIEPGLRASYMRHAYDFYKPDLTSEYPVVDGKLSVQSYITALDNCYQNYCRKASKKIKTKSSTFNLSNIDYMLFHSPYCKLVQKSVARIVLNDYVHQEHQHYSKDDQTQLKDLCQFKDASLDNSIFNKPLETAFVKASECLFERKTKPSLLLARQVGNMYTPSLYSCLASLLISTSLNELTGKRIGLFSYGSGLAASMFSLRVTEHAGLPEVVNPAKVNDLPTFTLHSLVSGLLEIRVKLKQRTQLEPERFTAILECREKTHTLANYSPQSTNEHIFPGTYHLTHVDEKFRRTYERKPLPHPDMNGNSSQNGAENFTHTNGF